MANSLTRVTVRNESRERDLNVVIFQKNRAPGAGELAVAWRVQRLGLFQAFTFEFPTQLQASAADAFGNETARLTAERGQAYEVVSSGGGQVLQASKPAASGALTEVHNALTTGSISVQVYRNGDLLDNKSGIAPGGHADFAFGNGIFIAIAGDATQGQLLSSAVQPLGQEVELGGLQSLELTITGGGSGSDATALQLIVGHSS